MPDFIEQAMPFLGNEIPYMSLETKLKVESIFMGPDDCLTILKEFNLVEKAKQTNPDIVENLEWFKEMWENGYYIMRTE